MRELVQKKVLNYRKFKILSDRLQIENKENGKLSRFSVPLDEIGYEKTYQADKNIFAKLVWYLFIAIPFFVIALYFLIDNPETLDIKTVIITSGGFWIVGILGYLHPMQDDVILEGYKNIFFYRDAPNEETVNDFIEELIKASKDYQREKYLDLEEDISEEVFIHRLKFLLKNNIISKSEYEVILEAFRMKRLL